MRRLTGSPAVLTAAALVTTLSVLSGPAARADLPPPLTGAGSTWAAPAVNQWTALAVTNGLRVGYTSTGSTDGRARFAQSLVDIAVTDLPYRTSDPDEALPDRPYHYVPLLGRATGLVYNLTSGGRQITGLRLSGPTIAGIFARTITTWDAPRIRADNPGLALPATPIVPVVRTDAAATSDLLTRWLATRHPDAWSALCRATDRGAGCAPGTLFPAADGTVGQVGSAAVTAYVAKPSSAGAIGFVEPLYAENGRLPQVKVLNARYVYVGPTDPAVAIALSSAVPVADTRGELDGTVRVNSSDARAYPLSDVGYAVVPSAATPSFDAVRGNALGAYLGHAVCQGQQVSARIGYAPLPANVVRLGLDQAASIPGADLTALDLAECNPSIIGPGGSNRLLRGVPAPLPCERLGATVCGVPSSCRPPWSPAAQRHAERLRTLRGFRPACG